MITNYLLQVVAAYNKWKMQQLATVSATVSATHLQQVQHICNNSATTQTQ